MGVIFDKINAEAAAREGLIAAAGVGRIHLLPMRDRSLIEKRTRNIRVIRNDAAAKLGVLPSQIIQADPDGRGLRDFRIDFHRKGGAIDPRGRYSIFATATDLSSEKRYVVGNAEHERLRTNAAPTGRRTANVIGTDELGLPIYEIVEDVQGAVLSHLTAQVVRHLKPVIVGSAEAKALGVVEWGSTVDTVFPDLDGYMRHTSTNATFATIRNGAGTSAASSSALAGINAGTTSNRFDYIDRACMRFDLSSYPSADSAAVYFQPYSLLVSLGAFDLHCIPTDAPTTGSVIAADYAIANWTMTSKGSIASGSIVTAQYNSISLDTSALTLGGTSRVGLVCSFDLNNSAPTWSSDGWSTVAFYLTATVGTDKDPYLELTTAAAAASGGMGTTMKMLLGLR